MPIGSRLDSKGSKYPNMRHWGFSIRNRNYGSEYSVLGYLDSS